MLGCLGVAVRRIVVIGDEGVANEQVCDVLREHVIDSVRAQHIVRFLVDADIQIVIFGIGTVRIDEHIHAVIATLHDSIGLQRLHCASIPYSIPFCLGSIVHRLTDDGPARIDVSQTASINGRVSGQRHLPVIPLRCTNIRHRERLQLTGRRESDFPRCFRLGM